MSCSLHTRESSVQFTYSTKLPELGVSKTQTSKLQTSDLENSDLETSDPLKND